MNPPTHACAAAHNPNLSTFDRHYRRRLRLPLRLNFEVQSKLAMFRSLIVRLPALPASASILDLGFGTGLMLLSFPASCALAGVDIAPTAVARMRRQAQHRGHRAHRFECLDLDRDTIPWPDSSMDLVLCSHVLEHVADDCRLLAEIRRLLKPHGHLVLMIPINESHNINPLHKSRYTPESQRELLSAFGFRILSEETGDSFSNVLERMGGSTLPRRKRWRAMDVLRGKFIGFLGACAVLCPAVWRLRCWGTPRDYGVLAACEDSPAATARSQA